MMMSWAYMVMLIYYGRLFLFKIYCKHHAVNKEF